MPGMRRSYGYGGTRNRGRIRPAIKRKRKGRFRRRRRASFFKKVSAVMDSRIETKSKELENSHTWSSANYYLEPISDSVGQGDAAYERIGNYIRLKSFFIKWQMHQVNTATDLLFRVIIFFWHTTTTPSEAEILQNVTNVTDEMNSIINTDEKNAGHLSIIYDKLFKMRPNNAANMSHINSKHFFRLRNVRSVWDDSSNPQRGRLYMFVQQSLTTNYPTFYWNGRLTWKDA